jgi:hypothetical protein
VIVGTRSVPVPSVPSESGRPRRGYRGERLGAGGVDFDLQRDEFLDDHIDLGFEGDDRRVP